MSQPGTALRPLDTLWEAGTIIRIILAGEALALVLALSPGLAGDRLTWFGMASFAIQWIALVAMAMLFLARRRLARASPVRVAQFALVALVASTWIVSGLAWLFLHDIWPRPARGWPALALALTVMALTVGLVALAAFQAHWRNRQLAVRAKQAELEALQARIRPHFLFNTLNTGIALVHGKPEATERLLLDLADLFRAALSGPGLVTLGEELALARRYLEIEGLRLGPRLEQRWEVLVGPDVLAGTRLPSLSLQPLVENAVRHGVEPDPGGGQVEIEVTDDGTWVEVVVRNGIGDGAARAAEGHGIGLAAVRARLEALPDGAGTLALDRDAGSFTARLRIRRPPGGAAT